MNQNETAIQTHDPDVMDVIRNNDRVYIAGEKYEIDRYHLTKDDDTGDEVLTAKLIRVYKHSVLRCPKDDCNGERIKVEDNRYASGHRWECNQCNWGRE